ncbi:MAG: nucleotidyltransferase [Candidatus Jacksonbacteria bacterium RIFOXYA2_FULL_44_7]|uniref:Nucleotidyltransferase n=1 Tax=Candidatus Jacksonbacteria bacterium RIFCSPLOWO2_02_FULL_44_20 TaxID=1798460 RepID=A0A1G2A5R5_9BACT|nr:MAG: Nucleotidyltransferase substrate binding protein, HI0074 family [Parcubacteria group bacterium GW2011_GWC2_44_17]OGY69827.1 MAG: nucleotidyltransferase [Candidatus Jacksonbacteria bacterium RIFCSPHIGHO2_02_FULL_44_25]OGY72097.1 MAG: nucleotidyltransferase [Candidatus Jacksonbacteria bacterium RIFCSPHIGHO2_12_FULL_44_12]OGY72233.1 MAG: nucleotidyltransferase [Candidatus Jacksonbacteria bacterium RIFCSPLOWO2_02_FULL_44_20]OGY76726.1 MAG: nucleotidyltransferase [Candidatus Jacksonbacteria 
MSKLQSLLEDFEKGLLRLSEALAREKDDFIRDSAIKRFEILFDLGWKTLKAFLQEERTVKCVSPKGCFREAYKQGLIEYDNFWIEICNMRNYATHAYDEQLADYIYNQLPKVLASFNELYAAMKREAESEEM